MKTEPGHSGAPEGGPLADAATTRSPPLPSAPTGPQAPKTAPRLIDQEHNKEAAEAASAERARLRAQIKEHSKMIFIDYTTNHPDRLGLLHTYEI